MHVEGIAIDLEDWVKALLLLALPAIAWLIRAIAILQTKVRDLRKEVALGRKRYHAQKNNVAAVWTYLRLNPDEYDQGPDDYDPDDEQD